MPKESGDATPRQGRACDRCRMRKIRCDRMFPCSNCRSAGTNCKTSHRPDKQKRSRVLISTQFEEKIDLIEKRLSRLTRLVESFSTDNLISRDMPSQRASMILSTAEGPNKNAQPSTNRVGAPPSEIADNVILAEGLSSLTAHSTFAIDYARNVVGSSQPMGQNSQKIGKLLDTLRHITNSSNDQHIPPKSLFPLVHATSSLKQEQYDMPPLRAAVQVLREAEGNRNFAFCALCHLISPRSLSDLCLKVYFSCDYSDAEFIIVNAALDCLAYDRVIGHNDAEAQEEHNKLVLTCQTNLETALSKLTLYIKPSYDMVLALVLGVFYAISSSNTSLAWVLVGAACQCSYSLGFHTRSDSSDESSQDLDRNRLLFWAVYFFEKTLSIRLGRSSMINSCDITVITLDGLKDPDCHAIRYAYQIVKLASLAGRIYDQLYSADALRTAEDTRTHRALELSQELHGYCAEARDTNQVWAQSTKDESEKEQIYFISASDEVLRLSMLTLIYRAMPPEPNSGTSLSLGCITSARCSLESHQAFVQGYEMQSSSLRLSIYVNWAILFTPFVPFIVLFCHTIETRNKEDLSRMHTFLESIRGACQHSNAIAKQHHLFGVFYSVALGYMELGLPSSPMEEEQLKLRNEVNAHLSALGLRPHTTDVISHPTERAEDSTSSVCPSVGVSEENRADEGNTWVQDPGVGRWLSFNQQMMGLFDSNYLPF